MATIKKKSAAGRPTKYDPKAMLPQVKKLIFLGANDVQIADFLNVDISNFYKWQQKYPEFRAALLQAQELDAQVGKAVYRRATGYKHKATKIIYDPARAKQTYTAKPNDKGGTDFIPDEMPADAGVIMVEYIERYPPDTAAAKFWLENRQPKNWGAGLKLQLSGPDGGPIQTQPVDNLSFEELMKLKYGPGYLTENVDPNADSQEEA